MPADDIASIDSSVAAAPAVSAAPAADAALAGGAGGAAQAPSAVAPVGKAPAKAPAKAAPKDPVSEPAVGAKDDAAVDDDGLGLDETDDDVAKAPATWPDDWREKIAGPDTKFLSELKRFGSFDAYAKSTRALRQKLSSGEFRRASLPDDASEAEKTEWREQNDIPDNPDGYGLPEIKGHEWSDADKPIVGDFLKDLHAAGTPKAIANQALSWYAKFQTQQAEHRADLDRQAHAEREDALRAEWGPSDYRPQTNLANRVWKDDAIVSPALRQALASARDAAGRPLRMHPDLTRLMAQIGMQTYGAASLISGEQGARMGSRIDEIKKVMATDLEKYYADGLDKEYLELQQKMESGRAR